MNDPSVSHNQDQEATGEGFSAQLAQVRQRLAALHEREGALQLELLVQDLQTAVEELRVADEEVRTQQTEIARLLEDQQLLRWRYERMLSSLPVPVLTTDHRGQILGVNAAAAAILGVPLASLLHKPLFALVEQADRGGLRDLLSSVVSGGAPHAHRVRLNLREGPEELDLTLTITPRSGDAVTWVMSNLFSRDRAAAWEGRLSLSGALARLFDLASCVADRQDVLQQTAYVVADTLCDGAAVSVILGSPTEPSSVATSAQEAHILDAWQLRSGEGPTVLASTSGQPVTSLDLRTDGRWPPPDGLPDDLAAAAVVAGPLHQGDQSHGALTAYLPSGTGADPRLVEHLEILAASVSSLIQELGLRAHIDTLSEDMHAALASRAVIEQAKGIVIAAKNCSADEAFDHLVMLSNTGHLKLRDVARQIVLGAGG